MSDTVTLRIQSTDREISETPDENGDLVITIQPIVLEDGFGCSLYDEILDWTEIGRDDASGWVDLEATLPEDIATEDMPEVQWGPFSRYQAAGPVPEPVEEEE